MSDTLKLRLKKLQISKKLILLGSALASISVFLPWYMDIDKFNTGDMFLGITGPMYLGGMIVLGMSITSLSFIVLRLIKKPQPKMLISEDQFHVFGGSLSVFMLIVALSVYFHPKFGINLTNKDAGIGIILAFIGAGIIILGAILSMRTKEVEFEEEENYAEPLINIDSKDRVQSNIEAHKSTEVYDHGTMAVKNAVQDSLEEFTRQEEEKARASYENTIDLTQNGRRD